MKRKLAYLLPILGLLVLCWFFSNLLWGWSSSPILNILRAAVLAASVLLSIASLVWGVRRSTARIWLMIGILFLAVLVLIPPIFHEHEPNGLQLLFSPPLLGFLIPQLLPCLSLVMAAILLYTGLKSLSLRSSSQTETGRNTSGGTQNPGWTAAIALVLSALVLSGGFYHLYWLLVWDSTYDPIEFFLLIFPILAAAFSAELLSTLLSGSQKLAAPLYAILVIGLMIAVYGGAKQVDFRLLTETRAERISLELEKYNSSRGRYPDTLDELVPWTMLSIPRPMIMYGQSWCYQSTKDSYRLGYVDRENWSSPELFSHVFITRGPVPDNHDLCHSEIMVMKERYPGYYGFK